MKRNRIKGVKGIMEKKEREEEDFEILYKVE
jgi:hypothetical protein